MFHQQPSARLGLLLSLMFAELCDSCVLSVRTRLLLGLCLCFAEELPSRMAVRVVMRVAQD